MMHHNLLLALLMLNVMASFAEFEREILRERVRAGLEHARRNGQRLGRPITATLHADQVRKLHRAGISKAEIAPPDSDRAHFGAPHSGSKQEMKWQRRKSGFRRNLPTEGDPPLYEATDLAPVAGTGGPDIGSVARRTANGDGVDRLPPA
jgi:hypothetical protein